MMAISFPTNTVVAIIAAMIAASIGAWFSLARGLRQLPVAPGVQRRWRWGAAIVLLTWLLVVVALAVYPPGGAVLEAPYITAVLGLGLLAGLLPLLLLPTFRQIILAIPAEWLIGIHAIRLLGFLFLALMDMRLLPAALRFPQATATSPSACSRLAWCISWRSANHMRPRSGSAGICWACSTLQSRF
jgi:hypothetical protein